MHLNLEPADLEKLGSSVTRDDLRHYHASIAEPLSVQLNTGTLYNTPPPTQGLASLIILALYERLRVREAETLGRIIDRIADIRRSGSAAMDLCAVACGEVDAYYELHLAPWDTAAGAVIVEAAGAVFRQIDQPDGEVLTVAVPTQLLEPLLGLLGDAGLTV
jgi:fructose-1,6-bisphosphatase/inositol monophosphatase family enzyme